MKKVFIKTANYLQFEEIAVELESKESMVGSSMAMVIGRAGRGKTEAAKYYAVNSNAIYIRTLPIMSARMVLQEIAYELTGSRPYRSADCIETIENEMKKFRRLIIVDEADLLDMKVIETLRGLNEKANCPVMLIGEEGLKRKIASKTRVISRIRREMVFEGIQQKDIVAFYRDSLGVELDNEVASILFKIADGDWRPAVNFAMKVYTAMRASNVDKVTKELIETLRAV